MNYKYFSSVTLGVLLLFAFNLMACGSGVDSKPLLHPLFADHAVIQRDAKVPVWGWTEPGATVTVSFAGQEKSAIASTDGKWMAYLDRMAASGKGRVLKVQSSISNQKAKISDILVGDVWICSGQSNMEMGIGACQVPDEIAAAKFPRIRLLSVPKKIAYTPESTLDCAWQPCSPTTLTDGPWGGFSAAGYFFGRELHRDLDVPIGLIETCWGGTVIEAWTSGEAMASSGDFAAAMEQVKEVAATPGTDKLGVVMDKWYQKNDPGTSKAWFKPETDVTAWETAEMPANWNGCGLPGYEGIVWVQREFEVPAAWTGKELVLSFGTIGDCDVTWVNGIAVGRTDYYDEPRLYKVPAAVLKTGSNVIAMRVVNSGGGGFFGPAEQMKVYPSGDESSANSLAGAWRVQETATRAVTGAPLIGNPNISSVLYNGMIAPLIPFAIKGAIWYQGEANASRAYQYNALLQTMITDWRSRFDAGDFGFHIVSLANFMKTSAVPQESAWAELREAQAMAVKELPDCGIAMAIDIGDAADIHPKNKKEVGRRLALSALAITYGKDIEWSGPWYKSMEIQGKVIRLSFDHAGGGLMAKGDKLAGFAIAGANRKFVWADAVIDGTTILVSSPSVPEPVAVRYGWDSNPVCNLYNKENLPAVPFRTDEWPGITKPTDQQVIYPPSAVPIVDMHTHMDAKTQYAKAVEAMDQWGGTISITLAGIFWVKDNNDSAASPASVKQIPYNDMVYVKEKLDNRILFVPGAFTIPSAGIWWSVDDIKTFKKQGFVGLKLWPHGAILTSAIPGIHEQLDEAGRQGMPLIALHTGDPGTKDENSPAFPKFEDDAVAVAGQHPQTTFIFAHGLFMLENDEGLDKLAAIFDKYPNIFVDLAYTHNMRQTAKYTVRKARDFYIRYRDRLLFGTDVFAADAGANRFLNERKILETNQVTSGLSKGPLLEGFNLPDSVLNPIYYWNAARLIPRVREVLEARGFRIGYELGSFKFDRLPPDVTVNKLTIDGRAADITGTLGSVTTSLVVEIAGKVYTGVDNMNGTWKLPGDRIAGLPQGTYDVKVTATNSIGLVRSDTSTNELTITDLKSNEIKRQPAPEPARPLGFEKSEYSARRQKLMDQIEDGFAIIRNSSGNKPNLDFLYLCGVKVPNAILLVDGKKRESHLFYTTSENYLKGEGLSPEIATNPEQATGIEFWHKADQFGPVLSARIAGGGLVYTPFTAEEFNNDVAPRSEWDGRLNREQQFVKVLKDKYLGLEVRDCSQLIWDLRMIKSPAEIVKMRIAGKIGAEAMNAVMKAARPGMYEYELSSLFEYECMRKGCHEMAFDVIISSAENHKYLHYAQHNRLLTDGDFLVVDAGPSWEDYDTDISISFPVSGKFTPRQKEIYEACKAVSLACLEFYKPGITGFEVGAKVKELLISKGYQMETDAFSRLSFFKEGGITHSVGLATHDCGGRDVPKNVPLRAGMVFACDVFATFPDENLGVRVENTVLITENGCENLTAGILR